MAVESFWNDLAVLSKKSSLFKRLFLLILATDMIAKRLNEKTIKEVKV
jgi:hypothetical protein